MAFDIQEELKKLPGKPGVYLMHDADDTIIYVGKAISLKNRVRQYFQSNRNHSAKVISMVSHIAEFEYIVTDSEMEALILECNLIKEHSPPRRADCDWFRYSGSPPAARRQTDSSSGPGKCGWSVPCGGLPPIHSP